LTDLEPRSQATGPTRISLSFAPCWFAQRRFARFFGSPCSTVIRIIFSDTASYLLTGLTFIAHWPFRSPGYSIFTKLTSLGISAWLVIGVQAIIVVYVLDKTCEYLMGNERRNREICLLGLSFRFRGPYSLPWLVSQLMPDVFAGIVFLSSFLLAFNDQLPARSRISLAAILMISTGVHTSLLPIAALFVALLIIIKLVVRLRRAATLRGAVLASLVVPLIAGGLSTATPELPHASGFQVLAVRANLHAVQAVC